MAGNSSSSGYSTSSSTPTVEQTPQSEWALQLSQLLGALTQNQYSWAMQQYNTGQGITNDNINNYMKLAGMGAGLAQNLLGRYENVFEPLMNNYIQQAGSYNSADRQKFMMGQAESTAAQADKAALDSAQRNLQGFGINPNSGRYQDLLLSSRMQDAATRAGAGTQASVNTAAIGRQMEQQAVQMGQNVPGMTVNALNSAYTGVTGAENAILGLLNTGANLTNSAANFGNAAANANKLPPVGQVSQSNSKQQSGSQQQDPNQNKNNQQKQPSNSGAGRGGNGTGSGANGNSGNQPGAAPLIQPNPFFKGNDQQDQESQPYYNPDMSQFNDNGTMAMPNVNPDGTPGQTAPQDPFNGGSQFGQGFFGTDGPANPNAQIPNTSGFQDTGNNAMPNPGMGGPAQNFDPGQPFDASQGWDQSQQGQGQYGGQGGDYGGVGSEAQGFQPGAGSDYQSPSGQYDGGGGSSDYGGGGYYAKGGKVRPRQRGMIPTTGGQVPRSASPSRGRVIDDIPARLNAGEFVIPRDVTAHMGTKHFQDVIAKSRKMRTGMAGPPAQPKMRPALPQQRPRFVSQQMGR